MSTQTHLIHSAHPFIDNDDGNNDNNSNNDDDKLHSGILFEQPHFDPRLFRARPQEAGYSARKNSAYERGVCEESD